MSDCEELKARIAELEGDRNYAYRAKHELEADVERLKTLILVWYESADDGPSWDALVAEARTYRAAPRGGGEPCTCDRLSTMELAAGDKCARCARGGGGLDTRPASAAWAVARARKWELENVPEGLGEARRVSLALLLVEVAEESR